MTALYEARALTKVYTGGATDLTVLDGLDISVKAGEMAAIMGASGSGKTTLLQILGTLAEPSSGELFFEGKSVSELEEKQLAKFRNKSIGFIFQFHHLLPEFSALENVMMPALIAGKKGSEIEAGALGLLDQVELGNRASHRVGELSGGEQQRTALARALIMNPSLLLADEPTGNLDARAGNLVFNLLQDLCRKRSLAVIMVTHNIELANRMDRTYRLQDGKLTG
ncbi:ABC transporter ATP-binding protein [Desulfopila sp. IMCC35008]|uniref:ABC transporter ATP-binding protein n=1 Tax=Desulfopila sp. IMCC35008 TaxID=2653858 RepID=UPI0013D0E386|nr:ABC transporter ATP-binding protein [Desulfopila sp. IMCC35008]